MQLLNPNEWVDNNIHSHTKNLGLGIYPYPIPKPKFEFDTQKYYILCIGYGYCYDTHTQYPYQIHKKNWVLVLSMSIIRVYEYMTQYSNPDFLCV